MANSRRAIWLQGAGAMGIALATIYLLGLLLPPVPYPPARIASMLTSVVPGDFATQMIEALGHWALGGLGVGVHIVALVFGGFAASIIARGQDERSKSRRSFLFAALLFSVALVVGFTGPEGAPAIALVSYGFAGLVFARSASGVSLTRAFEPRVRPGETPLDSLTSRRRFLIKLLAVIGGAAAGVIGVLRFSGGMRARTEDVDIVPADLPFRRPADDSAFPRVRGLSEEITENRDFYTVDINLVKPVVDHEKWRLRVHGLVTSAYELDYRQLQRDFEVVEMAHTLTCISNRVGGDLISTAVWRGVRLRDVLDRAGLGQSVVDVVFRAAEGYSDSIPVAKALEETTLVVFGMNRQALPRAHGFPARVIVPGIYGMKNVKWLTDIEAVDEDYKGYWMVRGWSDVARIKTQSRIDVPVSGEGVKAPFLAAGVAWAGNRRVMKVEISDDGGGSWREALLKRELSPVAWRLWASEISPSKGRHKILVRATDGEGSIQDSRSTAPHPDGASGYHLIEVEVE